MVSAFSQFPESKSRVVYDPFFCILYQQILSMLPVKYIQIPTSCGHLPHVHPGSSHYQFSPGHCSSSLLGFYIGLLTFILTSSCLFAVLQSLKNVSQSMALSCSQPASGPHLRVEAHILTLTSTAL